jgi:hypothetical protein
MCDWLAKEEEMGEWDAEVRITTDEHKSLEILRKNPLKGPTTNAAYGIRGYKSDGKWSFWISGDLPHGYNESPLSVEGLIHIQSMIGKILDRINS